VRIAILGWGSLVWDPRDLRAQGDWNPDGPFLPVEFARVSRDGSLTLVLYPDADSVQSLWTLSTFSTLEDVIENLRQREGTTTQRVGFARIPDGASRCQAVPQALHRIQSWGRGKALDAVIWTDLPSNFEEKTRMDLNSDNVIQYLRDLHGERLASARRYVVNAPQQITTRFRLRIEANLCWKAS
jgi:hypothetical protein